MQDLTFLTIHGELVGKLVLAAIVAIAFLATRRTGTLRALAFAASTFSMAYGAMYELGQHISPRREIALMLPGARLDALRWRVQNHVIDVPPALRRLAHS